jgi:hypothetical protein
MGASASVLSNPNERNSVLIQYLGNDIRSHLKVTLAGLEMIQEDNTDIRLKALIQDTKAPCEKAMKALNEMIIMESIHTVRVRSNITIK